MRTSNVTAILLIAAMLFAACEKTVPEEEPDTKVDTVAAETEVETEDPIAARTLQDSVPEMDFDGVDFRVLAQGDLIENFEMYVPELTGDAMNDAIYNRNRVIEDRFNIHIPEPALMNHNEAATRARAVVRSGEDTYDLMLGQMEESGKVAIEGNFKNIYDMPYVDLIKPWYTKSLAQDGVGTINGRAYMIVSDLNYTYAGQTWAMVYDKDVAVDYGITDIYDLVINGKWTIDKLSELTKDIYIDVNANNQRDEDDYYGIFYSANGCSLAADVYAMGVRTTEIENQELKFVLNTEKAVSVFEKISQLQKSTGTCDAPDATLLKIFPRGRSLFASAQLRHCYDDFREFENTYAIIPLPKWDEAQSEYYTVVDAGCNIIAVLITAQNDELIGAMIEALSAESWRTVIPTYIHVALGQKASRDPQSREMVDLVLNSRYMDFAYLYDGWEGWTFRLTDFLQDGTFASTYAKIEKSVLNHYTQALEAFYTE